MVADLNPLSQPFLPASCARLVVKIGSSLLVAADGTPHRAWLETLVSDLAQRHAAGQDIVIVSSGAIALGARRLGLVKGGRASLADAQAAASVGQIALSGLWAELLSSHGVVAAQMLLTLDDLEDRRRYLNASATLERLMAARAVPIINENDSVATQEIRFGDNDRLAARVAQAARADGVLLLSDIDGLYDRPPGEAGAQRIPKVARITTEIRAMAGNGSGSGMGSGGMTSKIQAADIAMMAGISLAIIDGRPGHPISSWQSGNGGTIFAPKAAPRARKGWLGGRLRMKGVIIIDAGAAEALAGGASLLAVGIARIAGSFDRGDVVAIETTDGQLLARGVSEYDCGELALIIGLAQAKQERMLGYAPRSAVIHRDHMVLL